MDSGHAVKHCGVHLLKILSGPVLSHSPFNGSSPVFDEWFGIVRASRRHDDVIRGMLISRTSWLRKASTIVNHSFGDLVPIRGVTPELLPGSAQAIVDVQPLVPRVIASAGAASISTVRPSAVRMTTHLRSLLL